MLNAYQTQPRKQTQNRRQITKQSQKLNLCHNKSRFSQPPTFITDLWMSLDFSFWRINFIVKFFSYLFKQPICRRFQQLSESNEVTG
jgi:hypothetical protein